MRRAASPNRGQRVIPCSRSQERGAVLVHTVVAMIGLLAFSSFVIDYGILWSDGDRTANGFAVTGQYDVAPGTPRWGWKTVLELIDDDHVTITAFNISPDGQVAKATETKYQRKK